MEWSFCMLLFKILSCIFAQPDKDKTNKKGKCRRQRWSVWVCSCSCGIVVAVYHMCARRREVCNMPTLPPVLASSVFCLNSQLYFRSVPQTLILFMLRCNGVNNLMFNSTTATSFVSAASAAVARKPLYFPSHFAYDIRYVPWVRETLRGVAANTNGSKEELQEE